MIFVTVGFHNQGFERLIKKIDNISKNIDEEIIMQIGTSKYIPKYTKYFDYIDDEKEYEKLFLSSRLIISHAGAGTILKAIEHNKQIIIVPRKKQYNEHNSNQQLELAHNLESYKNNIHVVYEIEEIEEYLYIDMDIIQCSSTHNSIGNFINNYLKSME